MTGIDWKKAAGLIGLMAILLWLWDTPIVYPLRVLVVFFHELSHGLMAVITGGRVDFIALHPAEGGVTWVGGGNRFLTLSAGYLGSMVWGAILLLASMKPARAAVVNRLLAVLILLVTLAWVRPMLGFGWVFGAVAGLGLAFAAGRLSSNGNALVLRVIGLTSCLYALFDIKSDIFDRPGRTSDAVLLAEMTGIHAFIWGGFWLLLSATAAGFAVWTVCRKSSVRS